jgi:ABC-type transport system substrate-binding protein
MKWFYVIALVIVGLMAASPMYLLRAAEDEQVAGRVVGYNVYGSRVKSIDPATCGDTTSSSIQGNFYEGLYTYHYLKRPLEVVPQLAAGLPEISEDGLTFTIPLKKGVRYARNPCFGYDPEDPNNPEKWGTRTVRAEDFVLAFKRIADYHVTTKLSLAFIQDKIVGLERYRLKTREYHRGDFSRYRKLELPGVEAVDEHTLRLTLTKRFPQLLYVLAMHVYAPIPREVIDYHLARREGGEPIPLNRRTPEIIRREAAVGTGPYILQRWVKGGEIRLVRNPDFREQTYPAEGTEQDEAEGLLEDAGKPVPFVDERRLTFVEETNPAWMLFEHNRRDTAGIPREQFDSVIEVGELSDEYKERGIRLLKSPYPAIYWMAFNMDDPVVGKSKSLRQALCLAFNVEDYIKLLLNGRGRRAVNTIPSTFKGHEEAGASPYAKFDLEAARAKVAQARKELQAAGVIQPGEDIPPLTLDLGSRGSYAQRQGIFAKSQFKKIGIELEYTLNDWPVLQQKVHNKQCQLYSMGWHADYPDAENFLQLYYSPNIGRGTNNTNYSNKEFDRLFKKASVLMDEEDRIPLYAEMIQILNEDCPVMLQFEPISYTLVHPWVHNLKPHPIGYGFGKYHRLDVGMRKRKGGP